MVGIRHPNSPYFNNSRAPGPVKEEPKLYEAKPREDSETEDETDNEDDTTCMWIFFLDVSIFH